MNSKHLNTKSMKTKIIALSAIKGGVGKTTATINLGASISKKGYRVLLIDLDPQSCLTNSLAKESIENNVYGTLLQEYPLKDAVIDLNSTLSIVPSCQNLFGFEQNNGTNPEAFFLLQEAIENLLLSDIYQYILIDCPPSLGLLSVNAYIADSQVFVPLDTDEYSIASLNQVISNISKIRKRLNSKLELKGVFFNKFYKRQLLSKEVERIVRSDFPSLLMETKIKTCIQLKEAPAARQTIYDYSPTCNGAIDFSNLANEILKMNNDEIKDEN